MPNPDGMFTFFSFGCDIGCVCETPLSLALQGPPAKRKSSGSSIPNEAKKLYGMFENDKLMDEQEQRAREITKDAEEVSKTWNNVSNRNNCGNRIDNSGGSSKPF